MSAAPDRPVSPAPGTSDTGRHPASGAGFAARYDGVVVRRLDTRLVGALLDASPDLTGGTVLDLGCRTGLCTRSLVGRVGSEGRVIGVEPDEALLELARRRAFPELGRSAFLKGDDLTALTVGDGVFDAVFANRFLERHAEEPGPVLRELRRVTAPGAPVFISHLARDTFREVRDLLVEAGLKQHLPDVVADARMLDAARPRVEDVVSWLEAAGFAVTAFRELALDVRLRSARALRTDTLFLALGAPELNACGEHRGRMLDLVEDAFDTYLGASPPELALRVGLIRAQG